MQRQFKGRGFCYSPGPVIFVMLHKNQIISLIFQVNEFFLTKLGDTINLKKNSPPTRYHQNTI